MMKCDHICAQIDFYLDDELSDSERAGFEEHVARCRTCNEALSRRREFLEAVRRSRPLYEAPEALRHRVEEILGAPLPAYAAPERLRRRVQAAAWHQAGRGLWLGDRRFWIVAAAALILTVTAGFWLTANVPQPPSPFALMAVDHHKRHVRGQLPLEISNDSPQAISNWFDGKVPFQLELPNYQESSGQDWLYELEGARLVGYNNDYAAYVAYRMRGRPISLLVTSAATAVPSGGEEIASRGLRFHYDVIEGLKVITWSDRGLTYALVSDLEERGQQSCIVCHTGTRDRDFIEGLKP